MNTGRGPLLILSVSLVIVMLGFGIVMPLMAFFVSHFGASGSALGVMMAVYSFMQFIFAPVWGRLSDRIGRKPVFLIGIAGYAISFVLQAFSQDIYQFILFRAVAGILSSATLPTAMAYIADTTSHENRSGGMGMMGAAMGLGMIFGPVLGGALTGVNVPMPLGLDRWMQTMPDPSTGQMLNLSLPFLASSALALVTIPFVLLFLPESLSHAERREARAAVRVSQRQLLTGALRGASGFLFVMSFLLAFALANFESTLGLYGKDQFNMGPADIGMIMGLIGILSVIQQGALITPLTRWLGEGRVLQWGLAISVIGMAGLALFPIRWAMILSAVVFNTGNALLRPAVSSLISKRATSGQGAAMGLSNSFQSLGRGIGPLWAGFAYDVNYAVPFWTAALIQAGALAASLRLLGPEPFPTSRPAAVPQPSSK